MNSPGTGNLELKNRIDELENKLEWKSAGTVTGTSPINIPDGASELIVEVLNSSNWTFTFNIPILSLSSTPKQYTNYAYFDEISSSFVAVLATLSEVHISIDTTNYSECTLTMFYR